MGNQPTTEPPPPKFSLPNAHEARLLSEKNINLNAKSEAEKLLARITEDIEAAIKIGNHQVMTSLLGREISETIQSEVLDVLKEKKYKVSSWESIAGSSKTITLTISW